MPIKYYINKEEKEKEKLKKNGYLVTYNLLIANLIKYDKIIASSSSFTIFL